MAIQQVDLKVPNGDTPRSAFTKVNANFSDRSHAASRLVGIDSIGSLPPVEMFSEAFYSPLSVTGVMIDSEYDANNFGYGRHYTSGSTINGVGWGFITTEETAGNGRYQTYRGSIKLELKVRLRPNNSDVWTPWATIYHSENTTKEAATGYLVASSPVLKVQHDNFEKVHEAEQLDIDVQRVATGVYEITGTTGLRDNDGWYLKPPKDINGNVLCICEATQDGDVITLKTYKKKFDFETVSIVADYEQPTDIPEGAEVMLRFNDLPIDDAPAL
ncbi:hypothetical protein [Psychrobacter sp. Marseille-P5312]|uniref:phage tail fiber protein n=1 Tax=Psychrobacter sp. Marseille-P5312 TaxID=2086574 RepID=UPI001319BB4F|nr:hypothetical protein [Psychrobacter sp. Marseille-P5312]